MGTIVVVKNLTLAMQSGQSWATDWTGFPAEHQYAEMVIVLQSFTTVGVSIQGQSSYDTVNTLSVGSAAVPVTIGTYVVSISSNLGPLFRVLFTATGSTLCTLSIYLTPKTA